MVRGEEELLLLRNLKAYYGKSRTIVNSIHIAVESLKMFAAGAMEKFCKNYNVERQLRVITTSQRVMLYSSN